MKTKLSDKLTTSIGDTDELSDTTDTTNIELWSKISLWCQFQSDKLTSSSNEFLKATIHKMQSKLRNFFERKSNKEKSESFEKFWLMDSNGKSLKLYSFRKEDK